MSKCMYCKKLLTKNQEQKHNRFCSKSCSLYYRNKTNDPDIFEIEDNDLKYYILGLIYSDGNIDKSNTKITLSLTDEGIIKKIYPYFSDSENHKIYTYQPHNTNNANRIYTIINTNLDTIRKMNQMGFFPCNSNDKKHPKVNATFIRSFLRGIFDGDGCIYINNRKYCYYSVSITSGSYEFAEWLKKTLQQLGLSPTIVIDSRRKNSINKTYYVKLNRQKEVDFFMNYIYDGNPEYKIQRKYDKYFNKNIV